MAFIKYYTHILGHITTNASKITHKKFFAKPQPMGQKVTDIILV